MKHYLFPFTYISPEQAFAAFAGSPFALFFDQNDRVTAAHRYSVILFNPVETMIDGTFEQLADRLKAWAQKIDPTHKPDLPFTGGVAGYLGYGLAHQLEKLPRTTKDDMGCPDMMLGLYDQALVFDHIEKAAFYVVLSDVKQAAEKRFEALQKKLAHIKPSPLHISFKPDWKSHKSRTDFERDIQKVIDYIHAGDIFQANLSLRLMANTPPTYNAYAHYLKLRQMNPAPYSAFLDFGDSHILSSSPELFLHCKNGEVITRPVKGTLAEHFPTEQLQNSEKDRAENIMIVDLMRNDLSRVCKDASIQVPELCVIETYRGLHHMVSTIIGTLRPDMGTIDLLKACFPGGSITGAPKIRAMEIIDELEDAVRGPYCGAIGMIGFDQSLTTSIAIRTMVHRNNRIYLNAGSGIVSDSNPTDEYNEMMLKAQKLQESFA